MKTLKKVILIDNRDSFTGNLYQLFDENPNCSIHVVSIDEVTIDEVNKYDKIVISPGPDIPSAYPKLFEILQSYNSNKSILGVCLGHQTIVEFFGGRLKNLTKVAHGKQENIKISATEKLFLNLGSETKVGLYHSWAVDENFLPECLKITAKTTDDVIMAVSHRFLDCKGIQFHPESYMTEKGKEMINNWIIDN